MKLWVVNHPYRYRRWLKVEARLLGHDEWRQGFIWSEWFGDHDEGPFHVPRVPATDLVGTNIDPLVIGPHMYFDYCRKATSTGKNNKERNELSRGDMILFGCVKLGQVIIDTIFVVGATKQWGPSGIPDWDELDLLARRVHFHGDAHERQHPEVHLPDQVSARSYRGEIRSNRKRFTYADEVHMGNNERWTKNFFSWLPFRESAPSDSTLPFVLPSTSRVYGLLQHAYREGPTIADGMKGSFPVIHASRWLAESKTLQYQELFYTLRDEVHAQGFRMALETRLLRDEPRAENNDAERMR